MASRRPLSTATQQGALVEPSSLGSERGTKQCLGFGVTREQARNTESLPVLDGSKRLDLLLWNACSACEVPIVKTVVRMEWPTCRNAETGGYLTRWF